MISIEVSDSISFQYSVYGRLIKYFSSLCKKNIPYTYWSHKAISLRYLNHQRFKMRRDIVIYERILLRSWFLWSDSRYSSMPILCEPLAHTLTRYTEYICNISYLSFFESISSSIFCLSSIYA